MRRLVSLAVLAAAVTVLLLVLGSYTRGLVYPAPPVAVPSPPPAPLEEVRLDLPVGAGAEWVHAWVQAPEGLPPEVPVALFFHGNGENLETMRRAGLFEELAALGVLALAADYPGYGRSPGKPREEGVLATGEAAFAWARSRQPERPVVLAGWSLGAAVALDTAARHPDEVAGVIALSPWTTLEDVARVHFPGFLVRWAVPEKYDSLGAARRLADEGVPVLVIHGARDRIIPAEQGRRVAEALDSGVGAEDGGEARWVEVPGAGHNDLLAHGEVWRELARFLGELSR